MNQQNVLNAANRSKERLARYDTVDMREQIVDTAISYKYGYCNIWVSVFKNDLDMCKRLHFALLKKGEI